ncbi:MAG TPA: DUF2007 domain-containing protein [Burkholderiaceae bacterium]|nr:DUF2007 domain-containing protein [Burkholderiaceae bacterium]
MRRLVQAPNLALATLRCDWLVQAGIEATVQRAYASGIAGEIPPDQALPEVWIEDDERFGEAQRLLDVLRRPRHVAWTCARCGERIEGPFEQCWRCGANMSDR